MDRLAEISRSTPSNRTDANDFTRAKPARGDSSDRRSERTERRDEVESRSDEKVKERERSERANDKPERFSLHLEEQAASLEPQQTLEKAPESEAQPSEAPQAEGARAASESDGKPAKTTATKAATDAHEAPVDPQLAPTALEIPAAAATEAKSSKADAEAPITPPLILPSIAPVVALDAPSSIATKTVELEPTLANAPRAAGEKKTLDVEGAAAKPAAVGADAHANQVHTVNSKNDAQVEAPQAEAPRETPSARSAAEVERAADILRQVRVQITPQLSEARIQLHPIELGRISIHLSIEDGRVKTTVQAEKHETLQAIQTHLPELRASLRQHGIDAQEFKLSLGFDNREGRDADKSRSQSSTQHNVADVSTIERSPALHAALAKTGVDFYA